MTPAETTVIDVLEERLSNNIKKFNGYPIEFKKVTRGQIGGLRSREYPAINFWPVRHAVETTDYGEDRHYLHVLVDARTLTRDESFADLAAQLISSVYTAITRTISSPRTTDLIDHRLGGLAEEVNLYDTGYQIGKGESPWCGAALEIQVIYVSPLGDLFNITQQ